MSIIKISKDYTLTPGARYKEDGNYSGEDFFEKHLRDAFKDSIDKGEKLTVDLDGTYGYASSFLSETFGLLVEEFGVDLVQNNLIIISLEEPDWKDAILNEYIPNATQRKKNT